MRTALISLVLLAGCGSHLVIVTNGQPLRLSKDQTLDGLAHSDGKGGWIVGTGKVKVPAGWYVVPPPPVSK